MRNLLLLCALSAVGAVAMTGCASAPRTEYYTLRPMAAREVPRAECNVDAAVTVAPFTVVEPYGQTKVVYRKQQYRVYFDDYRRWTSPPPRLMEQECAAWLRKSGLFAAVTDDESAATYEVEGRVLEFYELDKRKQRYAVVRLELSLVNRKGTTLFTIRPEYRVEAPPAEDLSGVAESHVGGGGEGPARLRAAGRERILPRKRRR